MYKALLVTLVSVLPFLHMEAENSAVLLTVSESDRQLKQSFADTTPPSVELISQMLENSRISGDERYLGTAEGLLKRLEKTSPQRDELFLLNAIILQRRHNFLEALEVLQKIKDPSFEALSTQAAVALVIGDAELSRKSCIKILSMNAEGSAVCIAAFLGVTGGAEKALRLLEPIIAPFDDTNSQTIYALSIAADIAARVGKFDLVRELVLQAINSKKADPALVAVYSDHLLAEKKYAEVITLLESRQSLDALAIRYAYALKISKNPKSLEASSQLEQSLSTSHARERALFLFLIQEKYQDAYEEALKNFEQQREPVDVRLLAITSQMLKKSEGIQKVKDWVTQTKLEDQKLASMMAGELTW